MVNLAGESVGGARWTAARKQALVESRVQPTRSLAAAIAAVETPPPAFISASGAGYYGDRGSEGLSEDAVESWRKILDRDREAATNAARDEAKVTAAVAQIEAGLEEIESWDLEGNSWKTIGPGLTRTYRRGRKAMKAAEAGGEADFHQWRKRAKDLWYELRLLSDAWPGPLGATAEEAHQLSELLGDHHDLAVLREDLRQRNLGEEESAGLEAAIDHRQEELAAEALSLGHRLYAERPQAFDRRLRRYWRA